MTLVNTDYEFVVSANLCDKIHDVLETHPLFLSTVDYPLHRRGPVDVSELWLEGYGGVCIAAGGLNRPRQHQHQQQHHVHKHRHPSHPSPPRGFQPLFHPPLLRRRKGGCYSRLDATVALSDVLEVVELFGGGVEGGGDDLDGLGVGGKGGLQTSCHQPQPTQQN